MIRRLKKARKLRKVSRAMRDIQDDTGNMKPTDYFVVKNCEVCNEW